MSVLCMLSLNSRAFAITRIYVSGSDLRVRRLSEPTHNQFYAFVLSANLKSYVEFLRYLVDKYWDKGIV